MTALSVKRTRTASTCGEHLVRSVNWGKRRGQVCDSRISRQHMGGSIFDVLLNHTSTLAGNMSGA